jgi:hypothetical protein
MVFMITALQGRLSRAVGGRAAPHDGLKVSPGTMQGLPSILLIPEVLLSQELKEDRKASGM